MPLRPRARWARLAGALAAARVAASVAAAVFLVATAATAPVSAQPAPATIPSVAAPARGAIRVEAPPEVAADRRAVEQAIARALPDLEAFFGAPLSRDYRVDIVPSLSRFAAEAPGVPRWAIGVAIPSQDRVVLLATRAAPSGTAIGAVAVHEIAHLFIHELGGDGVPRWLDEGIAVFVSGEDRGASFWDLARAIVGNSSFYLSEIEDRFPGREGAAHLAYYESLTAVQYIVRRWGVAALPNLLRATRAEGFDAAAPAVLGISRERFEDDWEVDLARRTRWVTWTAGGLPAASLMGLLVIVAIVRKRIITARKLARWGAEERREDLARQQSAGQAAGPSTPSGEPPRERGDDSGGAGARDS